MSSPRSLRWLRVPLVVLLLITSAFSLRGGDARAQESTNPVVVENRKPGTDRPWRDFKASITPPWPRRAVRSPTT